MKSPQGGDESARRAGLNPLLYIAVGAAFLLLAVSFRTEPAAQTLSLADGLEGFPREIALHRIVAPEAPELVFIQANSLRASTPPLSVTPQVLGAIIGEVDIDIRPEVTRYIVEEGDTMASIAREFGITAQTVADANGLSLAGAVKAGQELIILPVSGALHLVRPNDTLSEIASWYKEDAENILEYNNLASAEALFAGDILIIPNGKTPKVLPQGRLTPIANSYFIYPIPAPHRMTQGLHAFNAVDLSNGMCGESVYAAAGGVIQKTGYTALGGNFVRIQHPNGVVTYYGHLSAILTVPGSKVYQGQTIGYTGHTGYTIPAGPSGCHVHFEVRGAANPFAKR
ncbi:MAG: M23 family metallopeptidase [Candidatus Wildermuthbacteria bacterium]|nr:M23 family metallopeptidase [Candidatus Wildermuthbacteria bacterium]